MSAELRGYQSDIIADVSARMKRGCHSILVQSPTGSGKTLLTAHMLKTAAAKGFPSFFICHRRELIKQSIRTFHAAGLTAGIVAAGFPEDPRSLVQIASIQTLANRYHKLYIPKLIIWDECHHVAAGSWAKIYSAFPKAYHVGLTATPERLDGTGLEKWFSEMVSGPSVSWLIENKFLAPYRLYAPLGISTAGVHTRMGDFAKDELNKAADKPTITGDAIKHYLKHGAGKRAVVFCVSIEHSKHVVEQFRAAGISAAHVDGETDVNERDHAIASFERGEIRVLSNVELFGEGFDLPAIEIAILLRPTKSLGLFLQQCGRVLRPCPGKTEAIILDHAGNTQRHGLPDEERAWSLNGRDRGRGGNGDQPAASVRICPKCFAAQWSGLPSCKACGHVFEIESRKVDQVEGELAEIDIEAMRQKKKVEQKQARTLEELTQLGIRRNYRYPRQWALRIFQMRQAYKLAGRT